MALRREIVRLVEQRANGRCEYCLMHHSLQGATFHVEHITPSSIGGSSEDWNLAWCCPSCNLHKSNKTEATDPQSGSAVSLFNPRLERWKDHFSWDKYEMIGRTPCGRATVAALQLNHPRRILIRQAEEMFNLYPPR